MKTVLIPTDFSPAASNAAWYGLQLATKIKAHLLLCNAMLVPMEVPGASQGAWPMEDYESFQLDTVKQLQYEVNELEMKRKAAALPDQFSSEVSWTSELGPVTEVIKNAANDYGVSLVIMGMSGAGGFERFLIGSNSNDLIAQATFPVLLIPRHQSFKPVKKIAFATDLNKGDINVLHSLAGLAKTFNAEIEIIYISDDIFNEGGDKLKAEAFMVELGKKVHYPHIQYQHINIDTVDKGLNWLQRHREADMLTMVHRPHNFFTSLFPGSHTQKLARHVTLPLLVFPPEYGAAI